MFILDKYLKPIADGRADELHLYANVPPTYLLQQKPVKELTQSLNNDDILSLLREILGDSGIQELNESRRLNHLYNSPFGEFRCQLRWSDGDLKTRFTRNRSSSSTGADFGDDKSPYSSFVQEPNQHSSMNYMPAVSGPVKSTPSLTGMSTAPASGMPAVPSALTAAPQAGMPIVTGSQVMPALSPSMMSLSSVQAVYPGLPDVDLGRMSPDQRLVLDTLFSHRNAEAEIDRLFEMMLKERSSDLHISSDEKPMLRVDGAVRRIESLPVLDSAQVAQLLAPIIPERNRREFVEKWDTDFAYEVKKIGRFRANIFMDRKGVGAVFRLIPSEVITAEQLGLPKVLKDMCYLSKGLVLVTGPTGSGKSTTLCAMVDLINRMRDDHIITIEDPIEFVHPNKRCLVNQREVGVHTGSFKAALRAALREDPDVVLVGELRDLETMAIAIETAETGHLVFGTLHTSSAVSTVDRLIDQFPGERQQQIRLMLSNSLKGVISQTLLRKKGGGRVAAMEILVVTPGVANLIREQKNYQIMSIMQTNRALGMQCLNDVLLEYVMKGTVEIKEAYTKAIDKKNFLDMVQDAGINTSSLSVES